MEVAVKGRGDRVAGQTRLRMERKLSRVARLDPKVARVEVEVITESSRRVNGGHRVEVSLRSSRRTYRASATGTDVDAAVDRVVGRLQRQISDEQGRRRARLVGRAKRAPSRRGIAAEGPPAPPEEPG